MHFKEYFHVNVISSQLELHCLQSFPEHFVNQLQERVDALHPYLILALVNCLPQFHRHHYPLAVVEVQLANYYFYGLIFFPDSSSDFQRQPQSF